MHEVRDPSHYPQEPEQHVHERGGQQARPLPEEAFGEFLKNFEDTQAIRLSQERRSGAEDRRFSERSVSTNS